MVKTPRESPDTIFEKVETPKYASDEPPSEAARTRYVRYLYDVYNIYIYIIGVYDYIRI